MFYEVMEWIAIQHNNMAEELQLQLSDGHTVAAKAWGPAEGAQVKVLALHGWLDNAATFDSLAPLILSWCSSGLPTGATSTEDAVSGRETGGDGGGETGGDGGESGGAEATRTTATESVDQEAPATATATTTATTITSAQKLSVRLVALDFMGHGRSDHLSGAADEYTHPYHAATAVMALDALGWESAVLMGHSMGGAVALIVAATANDRVQAVVSLDGLFYPRRPEELAPYLSEAIQQRVNPKERKLRVYQTVEECVDRLLEGNPRLQRTSAVTLVSRGIQPSADGEGITFSHDLRLKRRYLSAYTPEFAYALLAAVTAPVLLVQADCGFPFPYAAEQVGALVGLRTAVVGGQHHVHLDSPDVVAPHVVEFLRDVVEAAA